MLGCAHALHARPPFLQIFAVLDDLDKLLVEHYSRATPYLCGETYTFADGEAPAPPPRRARHGPSRPRQTPAGGGPLLSAVLHASPDHRHTARLPPLAVLATCVIARSFWTGEGDEFVKARPKLLAYWERMRRRPSFEKAQIWTGLRPGRIFCVLGDMFSGAFRSVGSFLHETVVHPVQQTPGGPHRPSAAMTSPAAAV